MLLPDTAGFSIELGTAGKLSTMATFAGRRASETRGDVAYHCLVRASTGAHLWDQSTVPRTDSGILIVPLTANDGVEDGANEDLTAMSADFAALLDSIRKGQAPAMSAERRALAEAAVRANDARRDEDTDDWAYRVAAAVAGAND